MKLTDKDRFVAHNFEPDNLSDETEPDGDDLFADHILAEDHVSENEIEDSQSDMADLNASDDNSEYFNSAYATQEALKGRLKSEKDVLKRFTHYDDDLYSLEDQSDEPGVDVQFPKDQHRRSKKKSKTLPQNPSPGIFLRTEESVQVQPDERLYERNTLDILKLPDETESDDFDWTINRCDLAEWIHEDRVRLGFVSTIKSIMWNHKTDSHFIYRQKIRQIVRENRQSLEVHFLHLCMYKNAVIGRWLADIPSEVLPLLHEAASQVMASMFPRFAETHPNIYVRIVGLSIKDSIRNLRSMQLRSLINIDGVIVRRSSVFKQLLSLMFDCSLCNFIIGPLCQTGPKEVRPMVCPRCQYKGPFKLNVLQSKYRSHQIMILQESPSSVPPGRLPRTMELHLTDDLVDKAKPGDDVDVVGVFCNSYDPVLHDKQGFPVFMTTIGVNNITLRHVESQKELLDEDYEKVRELASHPQIKEKLLKSVAPSMHGHGDVKLGILLSLLGGVTKQHTGHRIRGDINVLLLGDPGTGKSQFLKWVERAAQRAVFTTGKGSSAVGLTAAVRKDPVSGEYVLEGGAMVIADRGVCLIDEFDKMNDTDRTSIHEAMEQQTISIARAGIVTTLSAQCTVIAAANPISGRYDKSISLNENVQLTKPILSRFDQIHIITDDSTPEADFLLGKFVTASHRENHPDFVRAQRQKRIDSEVLGQAKYSTACENCNAETSDAIPEVSINLEDDDPSSGLPMQLGLFKKYVQYARSHCAPKILQLDGSRLPRLFAELRQETSVTVRELESIIRLAEAHARIQLQEYVREEDLSEAIALFLRCYLKRHRVAEQNHLFAKFRKYLITDDSRRIPLIENRLEEVIHNELAMNKSSGITGNIVIPFQKFVDMLEKDGVTYAILHRILRKHKVLGGKVRLEGKKIVFQIEN